jgi:predicted secreted protein
MATSAAIGYGTTFAIGDGGSPEVFTALAEVLSINGISFRRETQDATHMASPNRWRELIPGLRAMGEITVGLNFIPGGASQDAAVARLTSDSAENIKITFPNAQTMTMSAYCTGFSLEDAVDAKMTASATFQPTGEPTFSA